MPGWFESCYLISMMEMIRQQQLPVLFQNLWDPPLMQVGDNRKVRTIEVIGVSFNQWIVNIVALPEKSMLPAPCALVRMFVDIIC